MNEYIESTHTYLINGNKVPGVTEILRAAGLYNESFFTEEARQRGTYIHKACLFFLQHDLAEDTIPYEYKGYIEAFKKFCLETGILPHVDRIEMPFFSDVMRYGGIPDLPCLLNNIESLIDLKTGTETDVTGIQLASYEQLMKYPLRRYGLYLKSDGNYRLTSYTDRNDIKIFNCALSLWHWRNERGLL